MTSSLLLLGCGLVGVLTLVAIDRERRLLLNDRQRRRFLVLEMTSPVEPRAQRIPDLVHGRPALHPPSPSPPVRQLPAPAPVKAAAPPVVDSDGEGVFLIDTAGQCTFADDSARALLPSESGRLDVGELLGDQPWIGVLTTLSRQAQVELTTNQLHIKIVALRDREDNLWGAALFVRRSEMEGRPGN